MNVLRLVAAYGLLLAACADDVAGGGGDPANDAASANPDPVPDDAAVDATLATDASADATLSADAASSDASTGDGAPPDGPAVDAGDAGAFPRLGVYTVKVDGGGLTLLVDPGTHDLSHVRGASNGWLVATRYGQDTDLNGLAMEDEAPLGAHYDGTQVVAFERSNPAVQFVVSGVTSGGFSCNPSWTDDGRVLFLWNAPGAPITNARLMRATFGTLPQVINLETLTTPSELIIPVDPHQRGPSDGGTIVFSATFEQAPGAWMRPLWKMPAGGAFTMAQVGFIGCPVCPLQGGCCKAATPDGVRGTNDARISHGGGDVVWMQQHPDIVATVGAQSFNPYRQSKRPLDGGPQVELNPPLTPPTTQHAYAEWRPDDKELTYWSIEIDQNVLRHFLWTMAPDGSNRRKIPLPPELCPQHPSYLSAHEIVFNAWRGASGDNNCDVAKL